MSSEENVLARSVTTLFGVGPERARQLDRLGILTVQDLLLHRPNRHEDRRNFAPIAELKLKEAALTCGKIVAAGVKKWKFGTRSVFTMVLDDGTARLHCRWFNAAYMEDYFKVGEEVVVFGKLRSLKPRTIDHPENEVIDAMDRSVHLNRIVPIYPLTEGLPQRWLRSLIWRTLEAHGGAFTDLHPDITLPGQTLTRVDAIRLLHFPNAPEDAERARRRLAFDEFVDLQYAMQLRRKKLEANARALPASGDNHLIKPFLGKLPFKLSDSQTSVLREIRKDMGGPVPMRRLLQGDVGTGKTVVAACTALMALESNSNVILMAPTEILAEQHFQSFQRWLDPLKISVELLTSSHKPAAGAGRQSTLFIGTHALIEQTFSVDRLGLVIIDEQHKFGVAQREQLVRKGNYPHLLVMTATPIPRTLGLTLYGDLDISTIEKPPVTRGQIKTFLRTGESREKVWKFVRSEMARGRQAYVIYSRLEEEDTVAGLKAVTKEFDELQKGFAPYRVGLMHGRLKSQEKQMTMQAFYANRVQVLLATSIVEVGLDVPNATVMVIENADQFGLAQLHQLRGRIGRGSEQSYCILLAGAKTAEAKARLKIMEQTTDGFAVAEADLRIRGPGEFLGTDQSGRPALKFGDLIEDRPLVEHARALVKQTLNK
ncbi:MAG: ATP-dependent helicase RecG [Verrucomicrobiales bacterium]|nr:ATP-dependent helicase RecG [Verrucomicrobiales bacterium]